LASNQGVAGSNPAGRTKLYLLSFLLMTTPSKITIVMIVLVLIIIGLVVSLFITTSTSKAQAVPSKQLIACRNSVHEQYDASPGNSLIEVSALGACQKMYGSN
jgi:disulfide bond formation protein DsbB